MTESPEQVFSRDVVAAIGKHLDPLSPEDGIELGNRLAWLLILTGFSLHSSEADGYQQQVIRLVANNLGMTAMQASVQGLPMLEAITELKR